MYLLEISFLLFLSLSAYTSHIKNPKVWQRSAYGPNDDNRNCFCYPEGSLPITQIILDSQNNGLERLVIYLYKNIGSNEIKMYTPSIEKQVLIPDIPYEAGDGLITVVTENISSLFYDNPHRVKVFHNRFETVNPSVIDSWPIGLNVGEVEIIYPNEVIEEHDYKPYNDQINDYIIDIPSGQAIPQIEQMKKVSVTAIPNQLPSPGEYGSDNSVVIEERWWTEKNKYPHTGIVNPYDGGYNKPVFAFKTNIGSIVLPSGSTQDLNEVISEKYVTFTIWFNQQMKRFQNIQLPNDIKVLKQITLRILVQKTLADNNIWVNADGVLVGSDGVVIDADNLELRPLLLGEKITQNIFQSSVTDVFLPKNVPYLEAILVTLVNPPQVLGIIPLGKTYLPQISLNTGTTYLNGYENGNSAFYSTVSKGPLKVPVKETSKGLYEVPVPTGSAYQYSDTIEEIISPTDKYPNIYTNPSASYLAVSKGPLKVPVKETSKGLYEVPVPTGSAYQYSDTIEEIISPTDKYPNIYTNPSVSYSAVSKGPLKVTVKEANKGLYEVPINKGSTYQYSDTIEEIISSGDDIYQNVYTQPSAYYSAVSKAPLPITVKEANKGLYGDPVQTGSAYQHSDTIEEISSGYDIYQNVYTKPLSSSNSYINTENVPYSGFSKPSYWRSEPYSTVSSEPIKENPLLNTQLLGKRRKLSDAKIEHHYEPLKSIRNNKTKKGESKKPTDKKSQESKEIITPEPLTNLNKTESGRRFQAPSLKSVMKTLLYLLDDGSSRIASANGEYSTETDDIVNGSENGNGGDQPDFRIIGGNAATGSGTPLSNKGRSADEEYI